MQVVIGNPGEDPVEVVISYIRSFWNSFSGIFWINCTTGAMLEASVDIIEKVIAFISY